MTEQQLQPIYLDNHATTAIDPRVLDAMRPWWEANFANPHSVEHAMGRDAEAAVERARDQVATLIGAEGREIIFTSGATEANNLAIKGCARFAAAHGDERRRILLPRTEHPCVLQSALDLAREGFDPVLLPVDAGGLLEMGALREALAAAPALLVSVMAVNNEIGVVQDVARVAALAHAAGALFHTDAAQAVGRVPLDVEAMGIDLLSVSGHKIYGPKGIGALFVRRRPRVRLAPLFSGGGQERGLRSGTLPTPLLVGLGKAAQLASGEGLAEQPRIAALRDRLHLRLRDAIPGLLRNGDARDVVAGNLNLAFPGVTAQAMLEHLDGLCVSTGSACSSAAVEPSHVLRALGIGAERASASLRIGIGRFTSPEDVERAAALLIGAWRQALPATRDAAE
ncbi:cysteine desulfurase family protein [Teichococcus oryzae]|uniref:Cysteine desulfurase n=1 Tax=Teichococcus oryzae TaxID=1608942 RepID=A0A5B2TLS4_9PROT|nr:aminotransferase class V-fold PLP-dependent enzyme [Pseudoroseomonas oryzae]KAA2215134.1 aminotransferase class V-fold PLP-dependent enzyme [Pseudoroseomonas oryzae]